MRNIELNFGRDDALPQVADALIRAGAIMPYAIIEHALGYLSTWSVTLYPRCVITRDGDTDFVACYYRTGEDRPGYVIGAVWHEGGEQIGRAHV